MGRGDERRRDTHSKGNTVISRVREESRRRRATARGKQEASGLGRGRYSGAWRLRIVTTGREGFGLELQEACGGSRGDSEDGPMHSRAESEGSKRRHRWGEEDVTAAQRRTGHRPGLHWRRLGTVHNLWGESRWTRKRRHMVEESQRVCRRTPSQGQRQRALALERKRGQEGGKDRQGEQAGERSGGPPSAEPRSFAD